MLRPRQGVSTSHSGAAHVAFERVKTLGPCNVWSFVAQSHTHAIAAYASRPLSPVATQHSLPSGRYSLLGPDFHRPDRTSLRLVPKILFDLFAHRPKQLSNGRANFLRRPLHTPLAASM
jgi:hypothetical protein